LIVSGTGAILAMCKGFTCNPQPEKAPLLTSFSPSAAPPAAYGGRPNILRRAEAWLDRKGRMAWIAAMVLGFIVFWPVGLFLVGYITYTNH